MKSQAINELRKQFHHEWLLIAVDQMGEDGAAPLTGRLLAHSPSRSEIYKSALQHGDNLMTIYSEDWPEDLAAVFIYVNFSI